MNLNESNVAIDIVGFFSLTQAKKAIDLLPNYMVESVFTWSHNK